MSFLHHPRHSYSIRVIPAQAGVPINTTHKVHYAFDNAPRSRVGLPGRPLPFAPRPGLQNLTLRAARVRDSDSPRPFSAAGRKEKRVLIGPSTLPGSGALASAIPGERSLVR